MKYRDLTFALAGVLVLALANVAPVRAAGTPCPPPQIDVEGGASATTPCTAVSGGTYSTNFGATENPISEGGKWVAGKVVGLDWNNPLTVPGRATASVLSGNPSRYNDSIAHLNTSVATFTPNQFAQATVYRASGYNPSPSKHEVELLLRFSITNGVARGYEIGWGQEGYIFLVRWNGALGNYTALYDPGVGSIPPPVDGDVLRAEITGNNVFVYRNGSLVSGWPQAITSQGGTTWSAGQPGMGFWPVDGATPANLGWKTYQAGNL
jgi:hypothetical protein